MLGTIPSVLWVRDLDCVPRRKDVETHRIAESVADQEGYRLGR